MPEKGQGFARRVTAQTLASFAPLLRSRPAGGGGQPRADGEAAEPAGPVDAATAAALALFQGESIRVRPPRRRPGAAAADADVVGADEGEAPADAPIAGRVVWRKQLVPSDVQRQPGHPTGGIRLVQADFDADGERIDQTRYFRQTVFGGFEWDGSRRRTPGEDAWVEFRVRVRGEDWGVHRLKVSHKPGGEGGQSNYTDQLHWGRALGRRVRDANLVDTELVMYAPAAEGEPFLLDIR